MPTQHGFGEFEHVIASHVQHGGFDLRQAQLTRRMQQGQLLYFLVSSQQVALHAVREKLQRLLPLDASHYPLPLALQALRYPLW